ncbi:DNA-binding MarR family transcriptional regulator [Thermocatellispora tengchongensis]|uniref:DNA-binding MarR family transcriptional regulator n=1 Tax=Thermocatellispora tengchongensis TaxID=1073253 RepID=A0A840P815_9ACTN|nr:MarR family transcriptional regulator [Thermocatellispora tengchongensis]MBB5134063.1 DNA-binding MarR family transcriptional regulator [Thermocatellispora tengchongensis]
MSRLPIDERIGHYIKRAEQHLIAAKHAAIAPSGLTVPQYTVLLVLSTEPGLSGAALARRCLVTPQTMSSVLATMERQGLIERTPHPRHQHVIETRVTPQGAAKLREADEAAVAVERGLAALFTPEEAATLIEHLTRCADALESARPQRH